MELSAKNLFWPPAYVRQLLVTRVLEKKATTADLQLAAEALALIVKYDTDYFGGPVLDMLIPWSQSTDLNLRHGATLAIAEVIVKLRLYRGKGGETMRAAVSRLIECQALTKLLLSEKK